MPGDSSIPKGAVYRIAYPFTRRSARRVIIDGSGLVYRTLPRASSNEIYKNSSVSKGIRLHILRCVYRRFARTARFQKPKLDYTLLSSDKDLGIKTCNLEDVIVFVYLNFHEFCDV